MKQTDMRNAFLSAVTVLLCAPASLAGPEAVPHAELAVVLDNCAQFIRSRQTDDGAFGEVQPHLQTALATLALLSLSEPPRPDDLQVVSGCCRYLVEEGGTRGDLADDEFGTESHALATTALLCALPHLRDAELKQRASRTAYRALRHTQRLQDRSRASAARGGWKMEGGEGRENDRRASAWALLSLRTAQLYGIGVKEADMERGARFVLGSFKDKAENADHVGGLSVDTEGLPVASISAMGGWILARVQPDADRQAPNVAWLSRHPPPWSGPNYFYSNFFRVRALQFADEGGQEHGRALRRLYLHIRDNQEADGSIRFPPGNAQNTLAMGPVFSTSMAVLILNARDSRLVFDEDYRVRPLF